LRTRRLEQGKKERKEKEKTGRTTDALRQLEPHHERVEETPT
jgi:hypothetical protein